MGLINAANDDFDAVVKQLCAPLYCNDYLLQTGHNESTTNATVTFIEFESRVYALTCHHVLSAFYAEAINKKLKLAPTIHSGASIYRFAFHDVYEDKLRWTFKSCRAFINPSSINDIEATEKNERENRDRPDIAIADITSDWELIAKLRNAATIKLNNWQTPLWNEYQNLWLAYGFPLDHKYRKKNMLAAPMPRVVAELKSPPSGDNITYKLWSTLETNHGWGFSGLSGGPVFAAHATDDCYLFVGITFEGAPSSVEINTDPAAFINGRDIILSGYHVTPSLFHEWLSIRRFEVLI